MHPHANGVDIGGIDVWAQILTERMATAPWLWDLPPNDRRYSPVYVACIEAGVPCRVMFGTGAFPLRGRSTGPPSDRGRRDEGAGCGWLRAGT